MPRCLLQGKGSAVLTGIYAQLGSFFGFFVEQTNREPQGSRCLLQGKTPPSYVQWMQTHGANKSRHAKCRDVCCRERLRRPNGHLCTVRLFLRLFCVANKSRAARLEMFAPGDNPTAANATRMLAYRQGFWQIDLCSKQIEAR